MYGHDLAHIHEQGFSHHADACAPGILALLEEAGAGHGKILEIGCGSGALTRHLCHEGLSVVGIDQSQAMCELARQAAPAADIRELALPGSPLPKADAIVSTGHVLNYLSDIDRIRTAVQEMAGALRPGGVIAFDMCGPAYAAARRGAQPYVIVRDTWAIVTRFEAPAPDRFVRHITTFVAEDGARWRRADERHDNVLVDSDAVTAWLTSAGLTATVGDGFGSFRLPEGMYSVVAR